MDTEGDELGTSDVAGKDLGLVIIVDKVGVLGKLKGHRDGSFLDIIRVNDVGFAGGQRRVKANAGELAVKGKLDGGSSIGHRDADNGVPLPGKVGADLSSNNDERWGAPRYRRRAHT